MLGNWLKRRVQTASVRSARTDIERFILSLRGQSADELGMLVAIATVIRMNLRRENLLPDAALGVGMPLPDTEQALVQLRVSRLLRQFQAGKQFTDAAGAMVWLHTLRAFNYPEVRLLGRQMWGELRRGFPHADDNFDNIEGLTRKSLPPGAREHYAFIPVGLEPFGSAGDAAAR